MNCIVVDDEVMGRKLLEDNVKQIPFLNLVGSCGNAFEAMEVLQKEKVDLLFLDIQMPGLLGTSFISSLAIKPLVVFVTAYANYAVESYNLDAVDYLMKPVSLDRFALSANKAYHIFMGKSVVENEPLEDFFFVNVEYSLVRISIPLISHIEGLKDYVKIYVEGERHPILTKQTMKSVEVKVMPHGFMRVHKSFIVNLKKIESIKQQRIKIGNHEIAVSDSHIAELMERLNANRLH
ncbi:LytR/AlgR family response regulator transcription factor [Aquirufa novilacunae]|uniref:LytTR family DNA-binding domain-containing protein n=1 Tax=Aquirufa novilacunae TaxID=3139305 RepID=A0ABW8U4R8_9BACT